MSRFWEVSIPIRVTADSEEEAKRLALDDLRDPEMEWDTFIIVDMGSEGEDDSVVLNRCQNCDWCGPDNELGRQIEDTPNLLERVSRANRCPRVSVRSAARSASRKDR